ncbi:MAG: malto-oligosyltrehalose trehalohydrolase [Phycisphaerae bacterium]|nr:malto-oligosyltrehalose trehalohydrolase [Phycisphaerae bacterium]
MKFEVWGPTPDRVELLFRGERLEMRRDDRGWWRRDVSDAEPAERYAFSLDGGPPRPDPRSNDQPDGVHESSRIVDHDAFAWKHPTFRAPSLASGAVYELHIGTFTPEGTFDAAIDKLDHLVDLGVTHVEIMPINAFEGERGWGYDGVCWYAPHRAYTGADGPDAVKRFVDACHARDLAVILDVVYNHLGPSGNYLREWGPYFSDAYATPWGDAMNLDGPGSDETRSYMIDNALMWLRDYRFDGLRLDAVHAFHDRSSVHILESLNAAVRELERSQGRPLTLIAESDLNDPRLVRSIEAAGYGLDAQWSDDFHHALHALLTGERSGYYVDDGSVERLGDAWRHGFTFRGGYSAFRGRSHGRSADGIPPTRLLGYAQDHDQIGNRATGDRLTHLVESRQLEVAAALVLLAPFVPMLFQGEEWGSNGVFQYFTDHQDPALAEAVRQGRRREFADAVGSADEVPDPQDRATFERSKLDWSERDASVHAALLEWHKKLIGFRRRHLAHLSDPLGAIDVAWSESPAWIRSRRGDVVLAFSLGAQPTTIPLRGDGDAAYDIILSNDREAKVPDESLRLRGWSVAALVTS